MKLGTVFPQTEIDSNPETVTEYARAVENGGFDLLIAYEHVLGVDPTGSGNGARYDSDDLFHEPLTLFAYLAAVTDSLTLGTSVLVLPQRQTALVAKQAAEIDVLNGGRLRLGVGVGWNDLEYEALGMDFEPRGSRIEEWVEVLRNLWTEWHVDMEGKWHRLRSVGINPLPVQRPIPIWMEGDAPPVLKRVGRIGDGWLPREKAPMTRAGELAGQLDTVWNHAREASHDPDQIDIIPRIRPVGDSSEWVEAAHEWQDHGASHIAADTVGMDLSVSEHIELVETFSRAMTEAGVTQG